MGVSEKDGTPKSSILIGFSIINHPFWGTPIFGNTHIYIDVFNSNCQSLFSRLSPVQDLRVVTAGDHTLEIAWTAAMEQVEMTEKDGRCL